MPIEPKDYLLLDYELPSDDTDVVDLVDLPMLRPIAHVPNDLATREAFLRYYTEEFGSLEIACNNYLELLVADGFSLPDYQVHSDLYNVAFDIFCHLPYTPIHSYINIAVSSIVDLENLSDISPILLNYAIHFVKYNVYSFLVSFYT